MGELRTKPLKIREAAEILGVGETTVRAEVHAGRIRATRIRGTYRIDPADLDEYRRASVVEKAEPTRKPPAPSFRPFKHLDGEKLHAAWTAQGVLPAPPGTRNAPSSGSKRGPSAPPGSSGPRR